MRVRGNVTVINQFGVRRKKIIRKSFTCVRQIRPQASKYLLPDKKRLLPTK